LRALSTRIEQGRGAAHEIESRQELIKAYCFGLAVDFMEGEPHGNAHEKSLWQFDAPLIDMQKIPVIKRLQTKVAELLIAFGLHRRAELGQVKAPQLFIEQAGLDPAFDELREVLGIALMHVRLADNLPKHFFANCVKQESCGHLTVGGILFNQRACRQNGRFEDLVQGHAVVEVFDGFIEHRIHAHDLGEPIASRGDHRAQVFHVKRHAVTGIGHLQA